MTIEAKQVDQGDKQRVSGSWSEHTEVGNRKWIILLERYRQIFIQNSYIVGTHTVKGE